MIKKRIKSLADLANQIDFSEYYEEERKKALAEKRRKESTMEGLGFSKDPNSKALNKNQSKHREKQYLLNTDYEDDKEESFESLFHNQYGDDHNNKVLKRNKARYKG